jgi:hypothetical protein
MLYEVQFVVIIGATATPAMHLRKQGKRAGSKQIAQHRNGANGNRIGNL